MFIALSYKIAPLRQERHVTARAKPHCAPLERNALRYQAINMVLLRSTSLQDHQVKTSFVQSRSRITRAVLAEIIDST